MGFKCEINYILKLGKGQGLEETLLEEGRTYSFSKDAHRIYPVDAPIDLANDKWEIVARVAVRQLQIGGNKTTGSFEVLKIYDHETIKAITKAVKEGEERNDRSK